MANPRGSRPTSPNNGPDDLVRVMRDEQIVSLRRDGFTLAEVAMSVGCAKSTVVAALKRWMDERGPSHEQVEELRQFQGAQLDAYQAKIAPHLMRPLRNEDREILYEGQGDERRPIEVPDVQVGQLWLRTLERRAKLYGLDLERSAGGSMIPTAEMLAELFFPEDFAQPIDVDSEELPADPPAALDSGADNH